MTLSNTALLKDPPAQSDAREISIAHSPDSDDAFMFLFAEVIKIMLAAGIGSAWQRGRRVEV
jgi:hypothetical protein